MPSSFRPYNILKYYKLGPLDLRSALTNRDPSFAVSMKNMMRGRSDALTIRPGSEIVLSNQLCPGPQKGLFEAHGVPHFCSDNDVWKLTQPQFMFRNISIGACSVSQNIISGQWVFQIQKPFVATYTDSLETGTRAAWWSGDYKVAANYSPNTTAELYDNTVSHSGSYSAHRYIISGADGGADEQEPFKLALEGASLAEGYLEFWTLFMAGYPWGASSTKICRLGFDNGWGPSLLNHMISFAVQGTGSVETPTHTPPTYGGNVNLQIRCFDNQGIRDTHVEVSDPIVEDTWEKWGIYWKMNTGGAANGIVSLYRNDTRIIHSTVVAFAPAVTTWSNGIVVPALSFCKYGSNYYSTTAGGTTGATPPTHTTGPSAVSDGGVDWYYSSDPAKLNYIWVGGNNSNYGTAPIREGNAYYDDISIYPTEPGGLSISLGTGLEAAPVTMYSLQQSIIASGWGGTISIPTPEYCQFDPKSLPAAHIPKTPLMTCSAGQDVGMMYWVPQSISWESGASSGALYSSRTTTNWNATLPCYPTQVLNNSTYIGAAEKLCRYDSYNVTSAGLKAPTQVTLTNAAGGSANGTYQYLLTFSRVDGYGSEIESDGYLSGTVTTSGAQKITLSNMQGRAGWRPSFDEAVEPWGAVVQGAQTVTISSGFIVLTLDNGFGGSPRLDVGDPAYLKNWGGGTYDGFYERGYVTAVDGKSITIALTPGVWVEGGSFVTHDNDPVSPGIIINIYRTQTGPSALFYRVAGIPIDVTATTQSFDDTLADGSLGAEYVFPEVSRAPFSLSLNDRAGTYDAINALGAYKGCLLVALGSTVRYSDVESAEYFPETNAFTFNQFDNSIVTGFGPRENHFLAFKQNSSAIIAGDITTGQYTVDLLSDNIGCVSPFTIQNIEGRIYWVDRSGVYRQAEGQKPELISLPIQPAFKPRYEPHVGVWKPAYELITEQIIAAHDPDLRQYIAYIPYGYYTPVFAGEDLPRMTGVVEATRVLVFNYEREEWYEWDSIEMARGSCLLADRGNLVGGKENNALTSSVNYLIRQKYSIGDKYDYSDGVNPIVWSYEGGPETLGDPSVEKKAVKARIESLDPDDAQSFSVRFRLNQTRFPGSTDTTKSITSTIRTALVKIFKQRGTSHSFTLSGSSLNEKPVITGLAIEYSASFAPFVRKED